MISAISSSADCQRQPRDVRTASVAKSVVRGSLVTLMTLVTAPFWLAAKLEALCSDKDDVFATCSQWLSLVPGSLGIYLRRAFYRRTIAQCAMDSSIGFGTTLAHRQTEIRSGVYIGIRCTLGAVCIEDHATIGSNVDLLSGRHQHGFGQLRVPIQQQGGRFQQIRIGSNAWVGNSSVVMADVGKEVVIGAGSVVVSPIPEASVAVGNPCVVKSSRVNGHTPGQVPQRGAT
jgi:virginiamycin A acetyltransferase